jgi:phosphatidylserine/phosphatidylglycerophosphate/cardiolipin synthase-like enzyme
MRPQRRAFDALPRTTPQPSFALIPALDPKWLAAAIATTRVVAALAVALRLFSRRRPPGVTLAWLFLIILVPFAGALLPLPIADAPLANPDALQIFPSGPLIAAHRIEPTRLSAICAARREITLATPYLVPGDALLTALTGAASPPPGNSTSRHGVRVRSGADSPRTPLW